MSGHTDPTRDAGPVEIPQPPPTWLQRVRRARTEYEDYLQIYEIVTGKRPIPDDYFPAHFTEDQKSRYVRDFLSEPPDYYKRNLDRAEAELRRLENNRP